LKVSLLYGADAVYLGGMKFGLRSAAENFTLFELTEGVQFAHERGKKVYVVLNGYLHDQDLETLPEFLAHLEELKVDAVIVSDLGVIRTVHKYAPSVPVHLSTQASCLSSHSAKLWKKAGVTRVVLGREVSIAEAKKIKEQSGLEVEMFVHGSMCMAYSGNCVISNFTQGRDSNRGGCAHSCRFEYSLLPEKNSDDRKVTKFFMSSKDLEGMSYLQEYIDAGIDSLKVEGRMKSHLYAGTIAKSYSSALDDFKESGKLDPSKISYYQNELTKVSHRDYAPVNLVEKAGADTVFADREHVINDYEVVGHFIEVCSDYALMEVRNHFKREDHLEFLPFTGEPQSLDLLLMKNVDDSEVEHIKPGTLIKFNALKGAHQWNLVRKRVEQ
jgi:putative protease